MKRLKYSVLHDEPLSPYNLCLERTVLHPPLIGGFSAILMLAIKARCAVKGYSLGKRRNAAGKHQDGALRVTLSVPMDGVTPFAKGTTIASKACLAMNTDKITESAN